MGTLQHEGREKIGTHLAQRREEICGTTDGSDSFISWNIDMISTNTCLRWTDIVCGRETVQSLHVQFPTTKMTTQKELISLTYYL